MNDIGTGTFSDVMAASITADVSSLLSDETTTTSAVFFTPGSSTMDSATGLVSRAGDQDTVTGWLSPLTESEAAESGIYRVGDQRLLALASLFTRAPNTDSHFTVGTTRYAVVGIETAKLADAVYYEVVGRPAN